MTNASVEHVPLGSDLLEKVWSLYRKNSGTLGFLPRGALEEFSHAGCVVAAIYADALAGYLAWRRSKGEISIVHLCVADEFRGRGIADALLQKLIADSGDAYAIKLRCRKDYGFANRLWQRHGFVFGGEAPGRGADSAPLFSWRRANEHDAPLLKEMLAASPRARNVVAIDANVFFDIMDPNSRNHEESSTLLADWIDDTQVCITSELRNEVSRQGNALKRRDALEFMCKFQELSGSKSEIELAYQKISLCLPEAKTDSDISDRRQLAHAWLDGAAYFATRDQTLLDHSDNLKRLTSLLVQRPGDLVARLQGDFLGHEYAPVRLHGTSIERHALESEEQLFPFQLFALRETKAEWLSVIRDPKIRTRNGKVELLGIRGQTPKVALSVDWSGPDSIHINFLRALSDPLTDTLLRRLLSDLIESAKAHNRSRVTSELPRDDKVSSALKDLEFVQLPGGVLARFTHPAILPVGRACDELKKLFPDAPFDEKSSAVELERKFWPLKILGADVPCYLVPIRPHWAKALFDGDLASRDLFGVPERPALALENVYFSGSNVSISPNGRILWYVSGDIGQVRAVSSCIETHDEEARELSRKYHRLGVYGWRDILSTANGHAERRILAYRFCRTEMMPNPVPWQVLRELILRHMGTENRVPSPLRIPDTLFFDVYRLGMRISE